MNEVVLNKISYCLVC